MLIEISNTYSDYMFSSLRTSATKTYPMVNRLQEYIMDVVTQNSLTAINNARLHRSKLSVLLEDCLIGNFNLNCILGLKSTYNGRTVSRIGLNSMIDTMNFGQKLVTLGLRKKEVLTSRFNGKNHMIATTRELQHVFVNQDNR